MLLFPFKTFLLKVLFVQSSFLQKQLISSPKSNEQLMFPPKYKNNQLILPPKCKKQLIFPPKVTKNSWFCQSKPKNGAKIVVNYNMARTYLLVQYWDPGRSEQYPCLRPARGGPGPAPHNFHPPRTRQQSRQKNRYSSRIKDSFPRIEKFKIHENSSFIGEVRRRGPTK